MDDRRDTSPGEEQALAALLRAAGPRMQPDPAVERDVRAAVEAEWRTLVVDTPHRRWTRLRMTGAAAAVLAALAILLVWMAGARPGGDWPTTPLATLGPVVGTVQVLAATGVGHPAEARAPLRAGDQVATGAGSRAVLHLAGSMSLRADEATRLTVAAPDRLVLTAGRVYLDSPAGQAQPPPLSIDTPFGTVRHLGTQYQVGLAEDGLQIGVREGLVEITPAQVAAGRINPGPRTARASAGERLAVAADGSVRRAVLPRHGSDWAWIHEVTPPYSIEQRPLLDFLRWAARETGRELVFGSPVLRTTASKVILRGSIAGLTPDAAVEAVLATTPLAATFEGPRLFIGGQQPVRLEPPAL